MPMTLQHMMMMMGLGLVLALGVAGSATGAPLGAAVTDPTAGAPTETVSPTESVAPPPGPVPQITLSPGPSTPLGKADRAFVKLTIEGAMAEVMLSQLVQDHGRAPSVRTFALRMIDRHGQAATELSALSTTRGQAPPSAPGARYPAIHARLAALGGQDFDKSYLAIMAKDHVATIARLRKHAGRTRDVQLRTWVQGQLPRLQAHLQVLRALQSDLARGVIDTDIDGLMMLAMPKPDRLLPPRKNPSPRVTEER